MILLRMKTNLLELDDAGWLYNVKVATDTGEDGNNLLLDWHGNCIKVIK